MNKDKNKGRNSSYWVGREQNLRGNSGVKHFNKIKPFTPTIFTDILSMNQVFQQYIRHNALLGNSYLSWE